jgi:menaquinone-9 beta-reductase
MLHPRVAGPSAAADPTTWDGVVIGAGPAGAMAARQLALGGGRVLLVEKKNFPRWKICGACLNGQGLAVLRSAGLGSLVTRLGGIGLEELRVGFRGRMAHIALPEGASVSRSRLDAALVEAATDAGARFVQEAQAVVGEIKDGTRLVNLTHQGRSIEAAARVVLVAAGLGNLCLAGTAAAQTRIRDGSRIGAGCLVARAPGFYEERTIFMAVGRDGYVGTVRVEDGSLNVAAALEPALVRRSGAPGLAAAAILAEAGFPPIAGLDRARWQGTAGLTRATRPLAADRLFLLGDAAGYVEPFTGEGIAWALASAQAVAPLALRAMERRDPQIEWAWSDLHRRLIGRRQLLCRAVATALRCPWLASIGFEVLTRVPAAAGPVIRRLNAPPSLTNAS